MKKKSQKRITIGVGPYVYETLRRLAQLQGTSMSAIVADLLEVVHPPLMRTVALLDAAAEAPVQIREGLKSTIQSIEQSLVASSQSADAQQQFLLEALKDSAALADSSASAPGRARATKPNPRTSNTGVRSPKNPKNPKSRK